MYYDSGTIVGLSKYKRKVQATEKILPQLCPKCRELVVTALAHK